MKLPVKILQSLAAAVAIVGVGGCNIAPEPAPTEDPKPTEQCNNPGGECPNPQPNGPGFRDPCPACGRG